MDKNPKLCRTFLGHAKNVLNEHPEIKHEWSIDDDEDHCILDIPETHTDGFPVTVEVNPDNIVVTASAAHMHIDLTKDNFEEIVTEALGLVRDLLSPTMRIREKLAGGKPYKWAIESYRGGKWITEEVTGLMFFNYFGKRTEKIYENNILPGREYPA